MIILYGVCQYRKPHGIYNIKMNPKMLLLFPEKKGCIYTTI